MRSRLGFPEAVGVHLVSRTHRCPRTADHEQSCAREEPTKDGFSGVVKVDDCCVLAAHPGGFVKDDARRPTANKATTCAFSTDYFNLHGAIQIHVSQDNGVRAGFPVGQPLAGCILVED